MDPSDIWLLPLKAARSPTITVQLRQKEVITAIVFWNYNKNEDDAIRGVKKAGNQLHICYIHMLAPSLFINENIYLYII